MNKADSKLYIDLSHFDGAEACQLASRYQIRVKDRAGKYKDSSVVPWLSVPQGTVEGLSGIEQYLNHHQLRVHQIF